MRVQLNFLPYVITKGLFTFVPLFIICFVAVINCFYLFLNVAEVAKLYLLDTDLALN